jgi:cold shock CspA family protein
MAIPESYEGVIISWFEVRNFGFIHPNNPVPGCGVEIFFHISDLPNATALPKNTRVTFEVVPFGGRLKAIKVAPVITSAVQ